MNLEIYTSSSKNTSIQGCKWEVECTFFLSGKCSWAKTGCSKMIINGLISLRCSTYGALRALISLNCPDRPHLGPPPHPMGPEGSGSRCSSVFAWAVLEKWCFSPWPCLWSGPRPSAWLPGLASALSGRRGPAWCLLHLTLPDLWGDFPAWPRTCHNAMIPPCDPDSWLDCLWVSPGESRGTRARLWFVLPVVSRFLSASSFYPSSS